MQNIDAREDGRHLLITFGKETDDEISFRVPPANIQKGRQILGVLLLLSQASAAFSNDQVQEAMELGLDAATKKQATAKLRDEEYAWLMQTAAYWQAHGGGSKLVKLMLEDTSGKAALQELLRGVDLQAFLTSVNSGLANRTPTATTSATGSPTGSKHASNKRPRNRKAKPPSAGTDSSGPSSPTGTTA